MLQPHLTWQHRSSNTQSLAENTQAIEEKAPAIERHRDVRENDTFLT